MQNNVWSNDQANQIIFLLLRWKKSGHPFRLLLNQRGVYRREIDDIQLFFVAYHARVHVGANGDFC